MIKYLAELKTSYETPAQAYARLAKRISAVTMGNQQIGQAHGFRLTPGGKLAVLIEADEERWELFQTASQDGAALFVGDLPVVGPAKE